LFLKQLKVESHHRETRTISFETFRNIIHTAFHCASSRDSYDPRATFAFIYIFFTLFSSGTYSITLEWRRRHMGTKFFFFFGHTCPPISHFSEPSSLPLSRGPKDADVARILSIYAHTHSARPHPTFNTSLLLHQLSPRHCGPENSAWHILRLGPFPCLIVQVCLTVPKPVL
jgi:hypothetical protein